MLWIIDSAVHLGMIMNHLDGFLCASHGHDLSLAAEILYVVSISCLSALEIKKKPWFFYGFLKNILLSETRHKSFAI